MKSITKRSIVIAGHKTSVSLEDAFWNALKEVAASRDMTLSELVSAIDADREHGNLSSAIRLFVLDVYLDQLDRITKKESKRTYWSSALGPSKSSIGHRWRPRSLRALRKPRSAQWRH